MVKINVGTEPRHTDEQMSKKKWTIVIRSHCHLDAILGYFFGECFSSSGIMNEHVQFRFFSIDLLGKISNGFQRGEVQFSYMDVVIFRGFHDLI